MVFQQLLANRLQLAGGLGTFRGVEYYSVRAIARASRRSLDMKNSRFVAVSCVSACTIVASAQSASVGLVASNDQPAPGETVTLTLSSDFTLNGAGPGVFGDAGLYGFGGTVVASCDNMR